MVGIWGIMYLTQKAWPAMTDSLAVAAGALVWGTFPPAYPVQ